MSLQYKAYLLKRRCSNDPKEIRRFAIDQDVTASYEYLTKKISSVFPDLSDGSFMLHWKDEEGDMVSFSSDDELMQALSAVNDGMMKIYITRKADPDAKNECPKTGRCCGGRQQWFQPPPYLFGFGMGQYLHGPSLHHTPQWEFPPQGQTQGQCEGPSGQEQNFDRENYLKSVGNAVAGFLRPFGIDVDVDLDNKQRNQKEKKCGKQKKKQSGGVEPGTGETSQAKDNEMQIDPPQQTQPEKQETVPMDQQKPPSPKSPDINEWTVVNDGENNAQKEVPPTASAPEEVASVEMDSRLIEPLNQMLAMGFNNNDGWLAALLTDNDYSFSRTLEKMQRFAQEYRRAGISNRRPSKGKAF